MRRYIVLAIAVLAISAITGCIQSKKSIEVATLQGGISTLDILMENNYGLNLKVHQLSNTLEILSALSKGEVDIAVIPAEMAAKFIQSGGKIKIIAVDMYQNQAVLSKNESIKSCKDLKDKKIAALTASGTYHMFRAYLKLVYGIDNVNVINTQPGSLVLVLKRGDVDAIVAWEPIVSQAIVEAEAHVVENFTDLWKKSGKTGKPVMLVWVAREDLDENAIKSFLRAREEAAKKWISDRNYTISILMKHYGISKDVAESVYNRVEICSKNLDDELIDNIKEVWSIAWLGGYLKENPSKITKDVFYKC